MQGWQKEDEANNNNITLICRLEQLWIKLITIKFFDEEVFYKRPNNIAVQHEANKNI